MVTVRPIHSKRDIARFARFHNDLNRGNPYFVPVLEADERTNFDPQKNPCYAFCDAQCFLAERDGRIVGRAAAIENKQYNQMHGTRIVRLGRIDFIDDQEVFDKLIAAVEDWGRQRGLTQLQGPLGFSDMDKLGLQTAGFDQLDMSVTLYNAPYYPDYFRRAGFQTDARWREYLITVPDQVPEKLTRMRELVMKRFKLHEFQFARMKDVLPYAREVFDLLNDAYTEMYGIVPFTHEQADFYANEFLKFLKPDYVCVVMDETNRIVGIGVTAPSISRALQKGKGRLFPTGLIHLQRAFSHNDRLDLYIVGVLKEYRGKGVNAIFMEKILRTCMEKGIKYAETGPELDYNYKVQSQWKLFDGVNHRARECFIRDIPQS